MKTELPTRVSESEFLTWPESMDKIELIDGDVVRSPGPTPIHQVLVVRIVVALSKWSEGKAVSVFVAPTDVRIAPNRIVQPDAFVLLAPFDFKTKGPITRIPDLCVEVLSKDVRYDRITKRLLYGEAGVTELWLVSPSGFVERWTGTGLTQCEAVTESLRTPLLQGFALDVASLFAEL